MVSSFPRIFAFSLLASLIGALPTHRRDAGQIQWVDCKKNVPDALQATLNITEWETSTLGDLPDTLKCGRLDVPLDYSQPLDDLNKITLGFSLYTPENPLGTIFFNPGGPGVEVQSNAWKLATNQSELFMPLGDYEWMMMDTRGAHGSSPLNCSLEAYQAIPLGAPADQSEFEEYKANSKAFAQSCLDNSSPSGSINHIGSQETIQDWESVRIALGKRTISLLGVSYGTYWFAEYVQRYPYSIDRAALDAVTVRGKADIDAIEDELKAVNRMLLRADAFCQFNDTCPFHDQGKGAVVTAWGQLLQRAEAGELSNGITADDLRQTVPAFLRATPAYDTLVELMALALLQNNASGLAVPVFVDQALSVAVPLFCPDDNIDDNRFEASENILNHIQAEDPAKFQMSFTWQGKLDCSAWPVAGRPKTPINAPNFPFLWVTSDFDANTPTGKSKWADFNHQQTPNSTLVVRHGDGHGSFFVRGPARDAIIEYLRTGIVSPSSNETLATIYPPGSFRDASAIPDPYSIGFGEEQGDNSVLE